ncbi:MAG TPA: P1 family peptidase [Ktedonobacterales bacterium]|nr:P1 family peptidase [Ktedonobacterales bacterium]
MHDDITDIPGLRVGHDTNLEAATGCTVLLCDWPAVGGVDVRGGAPATRETDLLRPHYMMPEVHAVVLTGGSAFGLDAASGVMRHLEARGVGYAVGDVRVPIVPAAALFDLGLGRADMRPDAAAGERACQAATNGSVAQGSVGAGTGATVGKFLGAGQAMKGGLGSASASLPDGTLVGALVAVNAIGDVRDPDTQRIIAGTRHPSGQGFLFESLPVIATPTRPDAPAAPATEASAPEVFPGSAPLAHTTIAVIATNALLTKTDANIIARMAHDGLALAIRPVHTSFDGDTIFALGMGRLAPDVTAPGPMELSMIGAAAVQTLARAVVKAIQAATTLHGVPAARDLASQGTP